MTSTPTLNDGTAAQKRGKPLRLAYLLSSYPAVSHTFFYNEITELRKLGFAIDVASINKPAHSTGLFSEQVAGEIHTTFYLKAMKPLRLVLVLLKVLLTRPAAVLRGLGAVLELRGWQVLVDAYIFFYLAEALVLGDWLLARGHVHLHVHFGGPVATVGLLTSVAWKIPYSMTIHGPEEFYSVDASHLPKKIEKASFVLCISDFCRSQLMKISDPTQWEKFHVVRLGVDPRIFIRERPASTGSPLELICLGRLVPDKGQLVLLRAFSDLILRGHDLRLRFIGDGTDRRRLEALVAESKLSRFVILEGALDHDAARRRLAQADIFVLASFAEGLPIALMEAMAMELPCVSTLIAGIPELIRNGVDGLLVPASSDQALSAALERLIANAELRRRLGLSGRRRVLDHYDLRKNVFLLADTLTECIPSFRDGYQDGRTSRGDSSSLLENNLTGAVAR